MTKINKILVILTLFFPIGLFFNPYNLNASEIISGWIETESLPIGIASNYSFTSNNNVYSLGGAHSSVPQIFVRSVINPDGTLSPWQNITSQPNARYWHTGVATSNRIFLFGGADENINNIDSVITGVIESDGDILGWSNVTPLPKTLSLGSALIVGDRIYYSGGSVIPYALDISAQEDIYMATINQSDGTLSAWSLAGTLPDTAYGHQTINIGDYFYVLGGVDSGGQSFQVQRAIIHEDGTLGSWEAQPNMYAGITRFGLVRVGNYLITVGGDAAGLSNKIFYSLINPDDTTSEWTLSANNLPDFICCNGVVAINNKIYSIGGHNGDYTEKVYFTEIITSSPSPTPTISPTSTPSPSPSPTPESIVNKVVIVPGFGGSWNTDAILNCKVSGYSGDWDISPFAKEIYSPLLSSIRYSGLEAKPFYYDFRRDVRENAQLLNDYINENSAPDEKVNFVGHSMGGLVGRSYMEQESGGKLKNYLSVGTPHKGVVFSYPLVAGNEIWDKSLPIKIAATILIKRCGIPPSANNTLPIFDYLTNASTNVLKPITSMINQNNYLPTSFEFPFWGVRVGTLAGTGYNTLKEIKVINNNKWPDGKPVGEVNTKLGDGTVLLSSAQLPDSETNLIINEDHRNIIKSKTGVQNILDFLSDTQTTNVTTTVTSDSALVLISFPGNLWIKDENGKVSQSTQGALMISNPKTSNYEINIVPQSSETLLIAAQFLPNGKIFYKEYKLKGIKPINKKVNFNLEKPKEDIVY